MNKIHRKRNRHRIADRRKPEEWVAGILSLPVGVQATVAKVIWWDHFGSRVASERWDHLDRWLNQPIVELNQDKFRAYLVRAGYTEAAAEIRINDKYDRKRTSETVELPHITHPLQAKDRSAERTQNTGKVEVQRRPYRRG